MLRIQHGYIVADEPNGRAPTCGRATQVLRTWQQGRQIDDDTPVAIIPLVDLAELVAAVTVAYNGAAGYCGMDDDD